MKKRLICLLLLLTVLCVPAFALEGDGESNPVATPPEWQDIIDSAPFTAQTFEALSWEQFAQKAAEMLSDAIKAPIRLFAKLCGVLILAAAGKGLCTERTPAGIAGVLDTVAALAAFSVSSAAVLGLMEAMQSAVESSREYLVGFIPVFASVLASCGQPGSALIYGGMFLSAANLIAWLLCSVGFPATRVFLAFCAASAAGGTLDLSAMAGAVCRWCKWLLTLCATVFATFLTLQSAFAQSADSLALKTGRFLLSSSIPVVGRALSDAMGGVLAGVKLLKGSVGFAAVAVLAAAFAPLLLQCAVYQLVFAAGGLVARAVDDHRSARLLNGLAECVGLYLSMAFFFCFVVISATVVMMLLGNGG